MYLPYDTENLLGMIGMFMMSRQSKREIYYVLRWFYCHEADSVGEVTRNIHVLSNHLKLCRYHHHQQQPVSFLCRVSRTILSSVSTRYCPGPLVFNFYVNVS